MPWFVDGLSDSESVAVRELVYLAPASLAIASSIVDLDWVQDGIDHMEANTVWTFSALAWKDVEIASSVIDFGWVRDGINQTEFQALDELRYFKLDDLRLVSTVVAFAWVQDGIEPVEAEVVDALNVFTDVEVALRILSMPFLETLEPADASAVQSLAMMQTKARDVLQRVLSHPTFSNGITDEWSPVVATLHGLSETNPKLIDTLLDPDKVYLEQRVIELPLAGETLLAIIRTAPGSEQSMDLLEHTVRYTEDYMQTSFPTGFVGWLFADGAGGRFPATNFGTHIGSLVEYDVDDDNGLSAGHLMGHEVAHYYWYAHVNWLNEGIAEVLGMLSENTRTDQQVEARRHPCAHFRTIAELEAADVTFEAGPTNETSCRYQFGERLFLDLYRNLGGDSFRVGLGNLYRLSQAPGEDRSMRGTKLGIEHVRAAFKGLGNDSLVDTIVARWYDGTAPYSTPEDATAQPNPNLLTVDGRLVEAYIAETKGGPATTSAPSERDDWLYIRLRWTHNARSVTEVPLDMVSYYEDGFEFSPLSLNLIAYPSERNITLSGWYQGDKGRVSPDMAATRSAFITKVDCSHGWSTRSRLNISGHL